MYRIIIYLSFLPLFVFPQKTSAQTHLCIHYKSGGHSYVSVEQIDCITFVDGNDLPTDEVSLTGSWLWGNLEAGYYELLTFNDDKTYMSYDKYFMYGFDTMTYGWYMQMGSMLTLQSNGFGYNRRYNWFILGLTDNAFDVMTKMGQYTYYRLQPEILHLQTGEEPLTCKDGDYFLFADDVVASVVDGRLQGRSNGTTYVQKYIAKTSQIVAYKVEVE